jgi:hypothetical protein
VSTLTENRVRLKEAYDVRDHLRRWFCVLTGGHYRVYAVSGKHVRLKCMACQSETPGWTWS